MRSGLERVVYDQLREAGIEFEYEPYTIEYRTRVSSGICGSCGERVVYQKRRYLPDFLLENGIFIEVKGRLTPKDRGKLLAVKEQHPELDLRMVFGANNKLNKKKEKRYLDWAFEHKIKACLKVIPPSWLKKV